MGGGYFGVRSMPKNVVLFFSSAPFIVSHVCSHILHARQPQSSRLYSALLTQPTHTADTAEQQCSRKPFNRHWHTDTVTSPYHSSILHQKQNPHTQQIGNAGRATVGVLCLVPSVNCGNGRKFPGPAATKYNTLCDWRPYICHRWHAKIY